MSLSVLPLLLSLLVPTARAVEVDGRLAVQHRSLARLAGPGVVHRSAGPAVAVQVSGDGREAVRARLQLARTAVPGSTEQGLGGRVSVGRLQALGPLRWGSSMVLAGESLGTSSAWPGATELAPRMGSLDWMARAGLRWDAGPARLRVGVGMDLLGVVARPGTTRADPDVFGEIGQDAVLPAALSVSGPWNDLAFALDAQASWQVGPGELVASVSSRIERMDLGHVERRLTVIQPELGWRFGGRSPEGPRTVPVLAPPMTPDAWEDLVEPETVAPDEEEGVEARDAEPAATPAPASQGAAPAPAPAPALAPAPAPAPAGAPAPAAALAPAPAAVPAAAAPPDSADGGPSR